MLKYHYSLAPNPRKVTLFLEEAGLPYEPIPVETRKGEQHTPMFTAINPNAKLPAIFDGDTIVFDSSAILLYLAERTGKFLSTPKTEASCCRGSCSLPQASDPSPASASTSSAMHPKRLRTRLTATTSRRGDIGS